MKQHKCSFFIKKYYCFQNNITIEISYTKVRPTKIPELPKEENIVLYPNPTTGELHIQISDMRYVTSDIVIYDIFGRIQTIGKSEIGKSEINISHLPAGIYFVKIGTGKEVISRKVVKQ